MGQYRNGIINSTGAAVSLALGFVPDKFNVTNYTVLAADSASPAVGYAEWFRNVVPSGDALVNTYTSGAPVTTLITSNGFTPVVLGGDWQNTLYTITGITNANPGVVTVSSVSPTNSLTLVNGMTFTISGVSGMTGLNTNRFVVAGLSGTTFNLYDTFGNPVNTTALGTYVSGGEMDVISYPPTAPVLNPVTGQVITPGSPAGLQYDIGYEGITLGTGVVGASGNVLFWEAFYATPTGW
jgi:hypothetical protein